MSNFDANFQSVVGLAKTKQGMLQNQQQFDQNKDLVFRETELNQARTAAAQSQFNLDRGRGFLPAEMRAANLNNDSLQLNNDASQFSNDRNKQMLPGELQSTALRNDAAQISNDAGRFSNDRNKQMLPGELRSADISNNTSQLGYDKSRQMMPYELSGMDMQNQSAALNLEDQRYKSYSSRYGNNQSSGYGGGNNYFTSGKFNGGAPAIQSRYNAFADGGQVQDIQAKGFRPMPVRVSNGEYEFTPEQVANIGGIAMAGPMAQ